MTVKTPEKLAEIYGIEDVTLFLGCLREVSSRYGLTMEAVKRLAAQPSFIKTVNVILNREEPQKIYGPSSPLAKSQVKDIVSRIAQEYNTQEITGQLKLCTVDRGPLSYVTFSPGNYFSRAGRTAGDGLPRHGLWAFPSRYIPPINKAHYTRTMGMKYEFRIKNKVQVRFLDFNDPKTVLRLLCDEDTPEKVKGDIAQAFVIKNGKVARNSHTDLDYPITSWLCKSGLDGFIYRADIGEGHHDEVFACDSNKFVVVGTYRLYEYMSSQDDDYSSIFQGRRDLTSRGKNDPYVDKDGKAIKYPEIYEVMTEENCCDFLTHHKVEKYGVQGDIGRFCKAKFDVNCD